MENWCSAYENGLGGITHEYETKEFKLRKI